MNKYLKELPLIAVMRGIEPYECVEIAQSVFDAGIRVIEVTLNSNKALKSISLISEAFSDKMLVGAGTVLTREQVNQVADIGGSIIISPNMDIDVIKETKKRNLISFPGVMSISECFDALKAGADGLKLFPSNCIGPSGLKAYKAVLPVEMPVFAVGGINENNMLSWMESGAEGFGLGNYLYKPGFTKEMVYENASKIVDKYKSLISK